MLAPRQHQGVNRALGRDRRLGRTLQLSIEKGNVKAGSVPVLTMREIVIDTETTGLDPLNGHGNRRDWRRRAH